MDDLAALYNGIEIVLWSVIGLTILWRTRHVGDHSYRHRARIAAVAFVLFGISDAVELQTGAWWRPWWLFAWKAGCVLVLAALAWAHHRNKARRERSPR